MCLLFGPRGNDNGNCTKKGTHPSLRRSPACASFPVPKRALSASAISAEIDTAPALSGSPQQRSMEGQRTCQTAPNVVFESVEELKAHYKSDWHRYNLKRKARKPRAC